MSAYAKTLAALLGGISTWGVTAAQDGISLVEWFGLLGVVATALAVFAVPNTPVEPVEPDEDLVPLDEGGALLEAIGFVAVVAVVVSLLVSFFSN